MKNARFERFGRMSHYKPYLAYKDSGVEWIGKVPEHWDVKAFKRLASIRTGQDYKDVADPNGAYPVIGSGGEFARASSFMFNGESVLLGRKGTIDKPLYINGPFWAVDTMFYTTIADDAFPRFVYYSALNIPFGLYSTNTALPSMTGEDISSHLIPAPDLAEQEAIAAFLDRETARIDALIAKKTEFIELLAKKRQALITHAVTKGLDPNVKMKDSGVEWIGEVPEHWEVKRLRHVAAFKNSNVDKKAYDGQEAVSLCNYTDVYYNEFITPNLPFMQATASPTEIEQFSLKKGDVIITKDSEDPSDIGIPSLVKEEMPGIVCGYHLTMIRGANFDTARLLHRIIQSHPTRAHFFIEAPGITRYGLSQDAIGDLRFCLPPENERAAIADHLDRETARIDLLIEKVQLSIDLLKKRRSAFITAAATGQIDLREST